MTSAVLSRASLQRRTLQLLGVLALMLGLSTPALADRVIPSGMMVGFVDSAVYPVITLKRPKPSLLRRVVTLGLYNKTVSYPLSVSVRIRDQQNRFMVYGLLPQITGKFVGIKVGLDSRISQIWVMTEAEATEYVSRPDTKFPPS
ncbi:hypothetical protein N7414_03960 [Pseudomonas sp. GD04087]|uniref:hypothetical protein n=2 Tax=Pseudomonas TaxID=286 RepID=UPI001F46F379|nr:MULTISPECIES: hypothetical protein [unclassified Pseudomonas]MDH0288259.1 hypothetical protein [Pseudomonas sp. GD04087]MDH1047557.1 hypothetical protein [Pseudomonas sp. GD03903]MDH2002365.1 hypothetical protein [Pseudomonas sp. GD03691]